MTIERFAGYNTGYGYIVGGGYSGYTDELDKEVMKAARFLERKFKHPVIIRFNSDRKSGGAFLKGRDDASVQLGAEYDTKKIRYVAGLDTALMKEEHIRNNKPYRTIIEDWHDDRVYRHFKTLNEAEDWLMAVIKKEKVSDYLREKMRS